jgi:hypothetical protein
MEFEKSELETVARAAMNQFSNSPRAALEVLEIIGKLKRLLTPEELATPCTSQVLKWAAIRAKERLGIRHSDSQKN